MELGVQDRLILLNVLPKEGDFTTLKILRDLQSNLSFTEEELKVLNFENSEQGTRWSTEGAKLLENVDISIGNKANAMIVDALQKLSADKKLTIAHLQTFEKFVED